MKKAIQLMFATLVLSWLAGAAFAQADLDVDSAAIKTIKESMAARHAKLVPAYQAGAVGLSREGKVAVRDANAVPLKDRAAIAALVQQENQDRAALYREIAKQNNHPEWEGDIRNTFAQRFVQKAQAGWYYQDAGGNWIKK